MALDLYEEALALLADFERRKIDYAIAGAVALAIHGVPRATADLDLLMLADSAEAALDAARARGFTVEALPMRFADGLEVRRSTKVEGDEALTLDLLLVNPNLQGIWDKREQVTTATGAVWVVSREGLIQMKAWANRDQDRADIERLRERDR